MIERGVVGEHEIFVHGQAKPFPNVRHDLGLFDRINAEFPFQILVEFNEIGRVAGVVHHDVDDGGHHGLIVDGGWGRCRSSGRRRRNGWDGLSDDLPGRGGFGFNGRRKPFPGLGRGVGFTLNTAVEVVLTPHVGDQFVLQHAEDHVVRAGQRTDPSQQPLSVDAFTFNRPPTQQRQRNLGTKASGEPQPVFHVGVMTTFGEVQVAQFWILFFVVGDGRNALGQQPVQHGGVFNAHRHGMAGEPLGVGNDQLVGGFAKGVPKGLHFRLGGTAASGRVGFVREKGRVGRNVVPIKAPPAFHALDETVHDLADVVHVKAGAVVGGIGGC